MSAFIEERRSDFGVEPICSALGVSASAYCERRSGRRSARRVEDERLLAEIKRVHAGAYHAYGSRRVWKELPRRGESVARCTVERLMAENGIQGAKRRGKPWRTTTPDPTAHRRPDLVERDFSAPAPNRLWVGDFTYLRSWEGISYFAFVIDAFSRKVVGWQLASHMRTDLVLDALRMALGLRSPQRRRRPGAPLRPRLPTRTQSVLATRVSSERTVAVGRGPGWGCRLGVVVEARPEGGRSDDSQASGCARRDCPAAPHLLPPV